MKLIIVSILLFYCIGCSHENEQASTKSTNKKSFGDSTNSIITFSPFKITNVQYSEEEFDYDYQDQKFICKTTTEKFGKGPGTRPYKESKEFFDYKLNKVFELNTEFRKIELLDDYYITRGLSRQIPTYFELNNYKTKEAFVKCTGSVWKVEIPNSKTIAFFGYRSNRDYRDTLIISEYYFSIN